jgi:hypothetical protein
MKFEELEQMISDVRETQDLLDEMIRYWNWTEQRFYTPDEVSFPKNEMHPFLSLGDFISDYVRKGN